MKVFLYHSLLSATFIVAKVSAEDNVENSYMRPRSLAHDHKSKTVAFDGDSFERVLQERGDEPAKEEPAKEEPANIVPYKSAYSKRPATCDVLSNGIMYVGEHAKHETDFAKDDYAALEPFLDRLKENLHSEMDSDEAEEILKNLDKKELMTSMFPQIGDPVIDKKSRRLYEETHEEEHKLHESWDSEEELDQYMAHAEYYIETFPFDQVQRMFAEIDDMDRPSNYRNMTVEELHVHYSGRGLSTLNHRQLRDDEDLRAFVEARGHRVLDACSDGISGLIAETIAIVISVMGVSGGIAKQAAKELTKKVLKKVGKEVLKEIGQKALDFGKERAKEAITSLYNQAIKGKFSVSELVSACTKNVSWWSFAFMVAEVMVFAACLVLSGGACFALKLALIAWQIIQWFVTLINTGKACKIPGAAEAGIMGKKKGWVRVDGKKTEIAVSNDMKHIWGVNSGDYIYYRNGLNGNWRKIDGRKRQISVSGNGSAVWGVNKSGDIYYRNGANGRWQKIDGRKKHIAVSGDGKHIWGVNSSDNIYYRNGRHGRWQHISGKLKQIAVDYYGKNVWGVNSKDEIYWRNGKNGHWQRINGSKKYMAVAGKNGEHVVGVNKHGEIYFRNGRNGNWKKSDGNLKNVAIDGRGNIWGINRHQEIWFKCIDRCLP